MIKYKKPLKLTNFSSIRSFASNRFTDSTEGTVREIKVDFEKNRFSLSVGINLLSFWIMYPQLIMVHKVSALPNEKPP